MVILPITQKNVQIEGFYSEDSDVHQINLFSDQHALSHREGESICATSRCVVIYIGYAGKKRVNR